jgi:capsular exopolysaccharide synthesis family protein
VITSAESGEGKTSVATGLARAAARAGTRTLLIEADLRRPALGQALDLGPAPGLVGALVGDIGVEDAICQIELSELLIGPTLDHPEGYIERRTLDVLPAGGSPPNPPALLESRAMEAALNWAKEHYELVVLDSAPLLAVSDSIPLVERVDGVIVVSRLGLSKRASASRLRRQLEGLNAPTIGVVVNDVRTLDGYYGYGYDNSKDRAQPTSAPPSNGAIDQEQRARVSAAARPSSDATD